MDERSRRIEARLKLPVILPALLVIPLIVIGESSLGEPWESVGVALNWSKRRLFSPEGLQYTAALAALTAVAGGAGFAALEGDRSTADGPPLGRDDDDDRRLRRRAPDHCRDKGLAVVVMLVGIGFVAILTGAVAQRFLAPPMEAEEEAVEHELDVVSATILRELRDRRRRLTELEAALRRASG